MPPRRQPSKPDPLGARYAECRAVLGHAWITDPDLTENYGATVLHVARCGRCHSERRRLLNRAGGVLWSTYRYSDGYLIPGEERPDREALRAWWIDHLDKEVTPPPE